MSHSAILPATKWSLDYEMLTAAELLKLLQDHIGTTLTEKDNRKLQTYSRRRLIKRLRELDQERSFPFMQLPPELRVSVYELLLANTIEADQRYSYAWNIITEGLRYGNTLYPAVLRTSKQVYSEAMPILYKQNKFNAKIVYHKRGNANQRRSMFDGCNLILVGPGGRHVYHQIIWCNPVLSKLFEDSRAMGMLRGMTHLSIKLDLVPPEERLSQSYVSRSGEAFASLCLSLAGTSNMKGLTIEVIPEDLESSKVDLAHILWPLMLLRTGIAVRFKGLDTVPDTALTGLTMEPTAEASFGSKIAGIRLGCHEAIKTGGKGMTGIRGVEAALRDLSHFGKWLLHVDDIVGISAKWKGIRGQADRIEASRLGV
jgi:hypothetical protein